MSSILARTLIAVAGTALAAYAAGWLFGSTLGWVIFSLVLSALLIHHVRHIDALRRWAGEPHAEVPLATGVWDAIFALLHRQRRADARRSVELARALALSRQVGRALPYGVAVLDDENRIIWCNDSLEAHFEINTTIDTGQPITNLVRQPGFVRYVAAGEFDQPLEIKTARADGLIVSVQLIPYGDSQRLLLSRDVTQATRLEIMRRDFVANVSHELRTPLTVLTGFLETVQELKLDPERTRDYLGLMSEQARRMRRIVEDLLMLSRLESAPEPPRDRVVDVAGILARVRAEAEGLSSGRHRIVLDAEAGVDLLGADAEIASAFANLASNAVHYTPAGGDIRLSWRAAPAGAEFSVEDTGVGIAAEHIPRLTERFYRVDRGRSRDTGGTGLGLAIVKHALVRHQATLEITSVPGKGSRFVARFPRLRVAAAETAPAAKADSRR